MRALGVFVTRVGSGRRSPSQFLPSGDGEWPVLAMGHSEKAGQERKEARGLISVYMLQRELRLGYVLELERAGVVALPRLPLPFIRFSQQSSGYINRRAPPAVPRFRSSTADLEIWLGFSWAPLPFPHFPFLLLEAFGTGSRIGRLQNHLARQLLASGVPDGSGQRRVFHRVGGWGHLGLSSVGRHRLLLGASQLSEMERDEGHPGDQTLVSHPR